MAQAKQAASRLVETSPDVRIAYQPQGDTLMRFHRSKKHVRTLIGPLGSGKTQSCISELLRLIDSQTPDRNGVRRSRWAAVRNTYPDLMNTTIKDFRAWTDPMGVGKFHMGGNQPPHWKCRYLRPDGTIVEAEVIFLAFDLSDDEKKARGLQLTGVWLNEAKELSMTNVSMLMSRVGRYPGAIVPGAKYGIIGDTNAPDRDHWMAKMALDKCPDGWEYFIQPPAVIKEGGTWRVNPAAENIKNLPPDYYYNALQGRVESWIRANLANEFVFHADGRPVHPDFNQLLHVAPVAPLAGSPIVVGIDFGRTPAATIWQRQPNGQWFGLDELATVNTSALTFGRLLKRHLAAEYPNFTFHIWGDPAGMGMAQTQDETPFDMLLAAGLDAMPAPTNDFEQRITALDVNLRTLIDGKPAIQIDPKCSTLIRGLAGAYQYRRVKISGEERFHDKPIKDATSHVVESAHYALLGEGEGNVLLKSDWGEQYRQVEDELNGSWSPPQELFE